MTMLAVQMFLLLLAAFLAGAILACFIRRIFFQRSNERGRISESGEGVSTPAPPPAGSGVSAAHTYRSHVEAMPKNDAGATRFVKALTDAPASYSSPGAGVQPAAAAKPPEPAPATAQSTPAPSRREAETPVASPEAAAAATAAVIATTAAASAASGHGQETETHKATHQAAAPATAPQAQTAQPVAGSVTASAGTPAAAAAPPPAAVDPGPADDLTRIRSIDAALAASLSQQGITRFAEIAEWRHADIRRISDALNLGSCVFKENWIEQAQILAKGGVTNYMRRQNGGNRRFTWDEAEGADSIQPIVPPGSEAGAAKTPAKSSGAETAALRSVRSEALLGEAAARIDRSADDLKRIRGIGVLLETKLNAMGIRSYEQIANWSRSDVAAVSESLDFKGRIERENWIEQARILASGGQTDFSRRVYRG